MDRINTVDNLRGIAFILMILHHIFYFYDVSNDYKTSLSKNILIDVSGHISRNIFIFLAGYSLYLSFNKNKEKFIKNRFKNSLKILLHAALISTITFIYFPDKFIRFGVLHFIGVATLLASLSVDNDIGLLLITIGLFFVPSINPDVDNIIGTKVSYTQMDYFPLNKWFILLVTGIIFSKYSDINTIINLEKFTFLNGIGKNCLNLYTLHLTIFILIAHIKKIT
jgi:uncharacterized membrane protein